MMYCYNGEEYDWADNIDTRPTLKKDISLFETAQEYQFKIELPWFRKQDIKVELDGKYIKINGERQMGEGKDAQIRYSHSLYLASPVKENEITAKLKDGVLYLIIPKDVPEKKTKLIDLV